MSGSSIIDVATLDLMIEYASRAPAGCFVEVGVYKGGSAKHLYDLSLVQQRDLHLFDTFSGTPVACILDKHKIGDFSDTSEVQIRNLCPKARIYPGIFPHTMPEYLSNIAFAHIDCDQYASIQACILYLYPRLVSGGIMWFDDFPHLLGARKAVSEHFDESELTMIDGGQVYAIKS